MRVFSKEKLSENEYYSLKASPFFPVVLDDTSLSLVLVFEANKFLAQKIWISNLVAVTKVLKTERSGEITLELTGTTSYGQETVMFPKADLNKRDIVKLKKYFDLNEKYSDAIIAYISQSAERAPHLILYESVGWFQNGEEHYFRTNKVITNNTDVVQAYEYGGDLNLENKISEAENQYLDRLNSLLATEGAMFAVVAGLSSALVGVLRQFEDIDNILIHLYGDSSKGKSTFLKLALSCWGKPNEAPLFSEWNSTVNAIYALLADNKGIAIGLDEASSIKCDYSTLIYHLAHGRDKAKCNKDSSLRELHEWSTTIISTAEESLIAKTDKINGIRARCFELFGLSVTLNAEHAEEINSYIIDNYGVLGEKLIWYIENGRGEYLLTDYKRCLKLVRGMINNNHQLKDRVSKTYAVLLQTAFYARRIGVAINIRSILNVINTRDLSLVEETKSADSLYNAIGAYVISNKNKFPDTTYSSLKDLGSVEGYIRNNVLVIIAPVFEKIARENRFSDTRMACKWLCQAGYLEKRYEDRYASQITIDKVQTKVYELNINDSFQDAYSAPTPRIIKPTSLESSTSSENSINKEKMEFSPEEKEQDFNF